MFYTTAIDFSYTPNKHFHFPPIKVADARQPLLITGRSGCGKTTLLHLLAGLLKPTNGSIYLSQTDMTQLTRSALDRFRGQHIGLVFQRPHFVESINVRENILLPLTWAKKENVSTNRLQELCERLDIAHLLKSTPAMLSQGELQRAGIARALINAPSVVLADEPTSALDDYNCVAAIQLLQEQCAAYNSQLIVVTHDNRLTSIFDQQIHLA